MYSEDKVKSKEILKMHNNLVEANFHMTDLEMRIFMYMLAYVKRGDTVFSEIRIPVRVFGTANSYNEIKAAAQRLAKQTLDIELIAEKKKFRTIPLISFCEYEDGWGYIVTEFNEKAKPYLLELKESFTTAELEEISKIKGSYIVRVYWLLKQYQNSIKKERVIEVEKFWNMFRLHQKKYRYADFKRQILKASQKKLKNTDMAFEFEEIREGRKVHALKFKLSNQKKNQDNNYKEDVKPIACSQRVLDALSKYHFSDKQLQNIINNVSEDDIFKTNYQLQIDIRDKGIANVTGYAYSIFQKRFLLKDVVA
jgi:plasmid replication initiation protein